MMHKVQQLQQWRQDTSVFVGVTAVINHRHGFQLLDSQISLILHGRIFKLEALGGFGSQGSYSGSVFSVGVAQGPAKKPPLTGPGHRGQMAVNDIISPVMSMWLVFK